MEEDWLNKVLDNMDSLPKAEPRPEFIDGLMELANDTKPKIDFIKPRTTWLAAASIVLLISANILFLRTNTQQQANNNPTSLEEEYGLNDNNPYNLNYNE